MFSDEVTYGYCYSGILAHDVLGWWNGSRFGDGHSSFPERALAALVAQNRISIRLPPHPRSCADVWFSYHPQIHDRRVGVHHRRRSDLCHLSSSVLRSGFERNTKDDTGGIPAGLSEVPGKPSGSDTRLTTTRSKMIGFPPEIFRQEVSGGT